LKLATISIVNDRSAALRTWLWFDPQTLATENKTPLIGLDAIRTNVTNATVQFFGVDQTPCEIDSIDRLIIGEIALAPLAAHSLRIEKCRE
jgi:hypothetical protein